MRSFLVPAVLGFACCTAVLASGVASEKDAAEAVKKFRSAYRTSDEAQRASAVGELGNVKHRNVLRYLAGVLHGDPAARVRVAAAASIASIDHPDSARILTSAFAASTRDPEVARAVAAGLGKLGYESSAGVLNAFIFDYSRKKSLPIVPGAIKALGYIGSERSVAPLIKLLRVAEAAGASKYTKSTGKGSMGNPERYRLKGPILEALKRITGGDRSSSKTWQEWWGANRWRLVGGARVVYLCLGTGNRWTQPRREHPACPHDKKHPRCTRRVGVMIRQAG